jgi:hypothetical protein
MTDTAALHITVSHNHIDKVENKQSHTTFYYITRPHVSTHHLSHHQVAAHLEVGMFTTAKDRIILLYNKKTMHIFLCAVRVYS